MGMSIALFEDSFDVTDIDKEGQRFDRVSRFECRGQDLDNVDLSLDINIELYKLERGDKFQMVLTRNLDKSGAPTDSQMEFDQSGRPSLADDYEYVMYGKVFKVQQSKEKSKQELFEVLASFGGLLMR